MRTLQAAGAHLRQTRREVQGAPLAYFLAPWIVGEEFVNPSISEFVSSNDVLHYETRREGGYGTAVPVSRIVPM